MGLSIALFNAESPVGVTGRDWNLLCSAGMPPRVEEGLGMRSVPCTLHSPASFPIPLQHDARDLLNPSRYRDSYPAAVLPRPSPLALDPVLPSPDEAVLRLSLFEFIQYVRTATAAGTQRAPEPLSP